MVCGKNKKKISGIGQACLIKRKSPSQRKGFRVSFLVLVLLEGKLFTDVIHIGSETLIGIRKVVYSTAGVQYGCMVFISALSPDTG
tara:strand:- start:107 stop:364 length:258 start_codon:yes stop_codon:yes gene_type:complete